MGRWRSRLPGAVRSGRLVMLCLFAVLLSGCLKLTADLRVGSDDTVTGDYVIAYKKDPTRPGTGLQTVRELLVTRGTATATKYDDGQYQGTQYHLQGVPVADLADFVAVNYERRQTGTIEIRRDADEFVVGGTFDFRESRPVSRTPEQQKEATQAFQVRIRLSFPADVIESNGVIDGRTVTWQPQPFALTTLQARAGAVPPAPPPAHRRSVLPAYLLAAGIVLGSFIAVIALALLLRRLRARDSAEPAPVEPAAADPSDFSWVVGERLEPRRTGHAGSPPDRAGEWSPGLGGPQSGHEPWQRPTPQEYGPDRPTWSYPAPLQPWSPGPPGPPVPAPRDGGWPAGPATPPNAVRNDWWTDPVPQSGAGPEVGPMPRPPPGSGAPPGQRGGQDAPHLPFRPPAPPPGEHPGPPPAAPADGVAGAASDETPTNGPAPARVRGDGSGQPVDGVPPGAGPSRGDPPNTA